MKSIQDILQKFNPLEDKYVSREFQAYGVYLAEKLGAEKQKSLYIKLAKTIHRPLLEKALQFVIDSNARNMSALFMWKLRELGAFPAKSDTEPKKKPTKRKKKEPKAPKELKKKVKKPKTTRRRKKQSEDEIPLL